MKQYLRRGQQGATLVMGLFFMTILMLTVVIAFRMSNTNLRAVGNMQSEAEAQAAAEKAIERVLSTDATFTAPAATNFAADEYGVSVAVLKPECILTTPVYVPTSGDLTPNIYIEGKPFSTSGYVDTHWDITATASGGATGARVEMHQGVRIILPDDPNPCP